MILVADRAGCDADASNDIRRLLVQEVNFTLIAGCSAFDGNLLVVRVLVCFVASARTKQTKR